MKCPPLNSLHKFSTNLSSMYHLTNALMADIKIDISYLKTQGFWNLILLPEPHSKGKIQAQPRVTGPGGSGDTNLWEAHSSRDAQMHLDPMGPQDWPCWRRKAISTLSDAPQPPREVSLPIQASVSAPQCLNKVPTRNSSKASPEGMIWGRMEGRRRGAQPRKQSTPWFPGVAVHSRAASSWTHWNEFPCL